MKNTLFYGDNLEVLRSHVADESIDLIYLDPPFNSRRDYNLLFREASGEAPASQIKAFGDTWTWSQEAEQTRDEIAERAMQYGVPLLPQMLDGMLDVLGRNDVTAYLVMMSVRLLELKRVLKPTGSFYLHCDPTASHYLKIVLDVIFGKENFRNEIVWKRKTGRGETQHAAIRYGVSHDVILFYAKSKNTLFKRQYTANQEEYLEKKFRYKDENGRIFRLSPVGSPTPRPNLIYEYKGYSPPDNGWSVSRERMEQMEAEGRLYFPENKSQRIQRKQYLDELEGETVDDFWSDIPPINPMARERLGYPTQKPEALLERIIQASSNEGDTVLDPFCGCGTTIAAAQKLKRNWLGIDVTYLAIALIESRLQGQYNLKAKTDYNVTGVPADLKSAIDLFKRDPYQFQFWALTLVPVFPAGGANKKGADAGIDGLVTFPDGKDRKTQKIIVQVKGGHVSVPQIRDLRGVLDREKAAMGFFISLESPTKPMTVEAASAGSYKSELWQGNFPRIQMRTVEELLDGRAFEYPRHVAGQWKQAQAVKQDAGQVALDLG